MRKYYPGKNHYLKKKGLNNNNSRHNRSSRAPKRIDIESVYRELKSTIAKREELQKEYKRLWGEVKRTKSNRYASQIEGVGSQIGATTHRINQLIGELCQYKRTHKAMNLAYNYLVKEIQRLRNIINHRESCCERVERGESTFIDQCGRTHKDTNDARMDIARRKEQLKKLERWLEYVSRYLVR